MQTRPVIEIDLEQVEELASRGLTMEQIAISLGIGESTLYAKQKKSAEIREAIKRGKQRGVATIANKLYEAAEGGNMAAMIFFLKTQGGWTEKQIIETKDTTDEKDVAKTLTTAELLELAKVKK